MIFLGVQDRSARNSTIDFKSAEDCPIVLEDRAKYRTIVVLESAREQLADVERQAKYNIWPLCQRWDESATDWTRVVNRSAKGQYQAMITLFGVTKGEINLLLQV